MHAVVRTYSGPGARELFELIAARRADVEELIRGVKGFVSYTAIETPEGGVTVTVCQDQSGTDESVQKARDRIRDNASHIAASPPTVLDGPASIHIP